MSDSEYTGPFKGKGETIDVVDDRVDRSDSELPEDDPDGPKYRDKEWLHHQYHVLKKSQRQIADECGVTRQTISDWLQKHNIGKRTFSDVISTAHNKTHPWQNEEWLQDQYVERGKSTAMIAKDRGVSQSTIVAWLNEHGIESRGRNPVPPADRDGEKYTDEGWLTHQYVTRQRTLVDIADECDASPTTIKNWLEKFGIKVRSKEEVERLKALDEKGVPNGDVDRESVEDDGGNTKTERGGGKYEGPEKGLDMSWSDFKDRAKSDDWLPYRHEDWLREAYHEKGMTTYDIAELCGVTSACISQWMSRHGIVAKGQDEQIEPANGVGEYRNKEWLETKYVEEGLTQKEIADICDVATSTIRRWMGKHDIDTGYET